MIMIVTIIMISAIVIITMIMTNLHCAVDDACWLDRFQIPHFQNNHLQESLLSSGTNSQNKI